MKTKILLLSLTAAAFSSCTTAYKSSQTPDDVYYSPARVYEDDSQNKREEEKTKPAPDYEITMSIRDYRWRNFSNEYDYDHSPYNYSCKGYSYGYYYNPYYYPWAIYTPRATYSKPVNTTPRMVNLNAYNGYNPNVASDKTNGTGRWANPTYRYNNSNSNGRSRQIILPNSSSSSNNNTRTYTPSSSGSSSSGSSSSGSSSSGSSVSRPGRG
ncbi:MAG: hypothetical protein IPP96_17680 [Chitinophagaceae bacterium]|nr:hypothetical protein [Chitinophagaceae bacterium]